MLVGIFPNLYKASVFPVLNRTISYFENQKIPYCLPPATAKQIGKLHFAVEDPFSSQDMTLALTLGGDGTLLHIAKKCVPLQIPVCGVNLGHLGFLTQISVDSLEKELQSLISQEYKIENRFMLQSYLQRNQKISSLPIALNDIVVAKETLGRVVKLRVSIGGEIAESYAADGIIVSTPTGSTGYSLSAGGPIVTPELSMAIITPICPHTLNARSLVVSGAERISLCIEGELDKGIVSNDGQEAGRIQYGDEIIIESASQFAKFIRLNKHSFFGTLHTKLKREHPL